MSIEQVVDLDPGGFPPGSWVPPADPAEFEDAWEESLFEAAACGDVGFADRLESCWWPELDEEPVPPGWGPADPIERLGRVGWLQTRARELNREQARFLAAVHQTGHAENRYDDVGYPCRDVSAVDEVGKALGHSTAMAGSWLSLAEAVIERLPKLHTAMAQGWLDLAKAKVFVDDTRDMPADLAGMVVSRVLPLAPGLTKKQLGARIEIAVGQLDPDWWCRREQAARVRTRVEWARNPAGTGEVALRDIGAPATVVIKARVDALAEPLRRAARAAGLRLGLPALRALAAQRLLDGSYAGLDDDALLDALVGELPDWHAEITGDDRGPSDHGLDHRASDDSGSDDSGHGSGGSGMSGDCSSGAEAEDSTRGSAVVRVGTVELRVRLSTALGLDDLPGELPGSGPLTARGARRMLGAVRHGDVPTEWRVVLVDDDGCLEYVLLARPDPPRRGPGARGHQRHQRGVRRKVIVELAAATTLLAALDPEQHPDWATLITRAQTQLSGLATLGAQVGGPQHPATSMGDAPRRFPGAALERFVRVRDRFCVGPLCTGLAHDAEIDHTRDWLHHGLTVAGNLGPSCRRCHRLKHDGGWQLTQPAPGSFVWRSPLGATYTVEARPVLEPPLDPATRPGGRARRVARTRRPPPPEHHGWVDKRTRLTEPDDISTPPSRQVTSSYPDEPPF